MSLFQENNFLKSDFFSVGLFCSGGKSDETTDPVVNGGTRGKVRLQTPEGSQSESTWGIRQNLPGNIPR